VAAFLERNGFDKITNLTGGIHAWAVQVDPSMAKY
jgi:rhodanese-related sulfurtransferase